MKPISGLIVNLRFTQPAEFTFHHNMAVDAFLRHLLNLGEDYTHYFSIVCPENGKMHFRPDEPYRFAIVCEAEKNIAEPFWRKLIVLMQRLPNSAPITDAQVPLRNNIELSSLIDLFDGKPVSNPSSLAYLSEQEIEHLTRDWYERLKLHAQPGTIKLTWLSPTRILKADHKDLKGEQRFCRDAQTFTGDVLSKRLADAHEIDPTPIQITNSDLFWVDTPYFGKHGQANTLGGMIGYCEIELPQHCDPMFLKGLLLSQYQGLGQRRTSGMGKFIIEASHATKSRLFNMHRPSIRLERSTPFNTEFTQERIIEAAKHHMHENKHINITALLESQITSSIGQIRVHDYHPPLMRGFFIDKKDGTQRALSVSPPFDRTLQKACSILLTPALDAIMSMGSYGYRKGLSRQQVRYEIQNLYRQGYEWIYESDIDDFFDSVNRERLLNRLEAVFGPDPLWALIERWMGQDVQFKEGLVQRPKGIPQGSPLSPLLANFFLDDFDSDLETYGHKILRFADDFIVMCKTQRQAKQAAELIKSSLSQLNLELNADKTHIVNLKEGFRFLGYLFREDHAIEIGGDSQDGSRTYGAEQAPRTLPPWLANLGDQTPEPVPDLDAPKQEVGTLYEQGTHIVLSGDAQILTTDNENLVVKKDDAITHKLPWEQIHAITLIGLHHMTTPAQHSAMRNRIPVHFASRSGEYLGALTNFQPAQNNYKAWFTQLQMSDNKEWALQFAKNIVHARINNQRKSLMRHTKQREQLASTHRELSKLLNKSKHAPKLANLGGYEGTATRAYFRALNLLLPDWAKFAKRTRRPPTDPFNVLLSLGYTILYSHTDAMLQSAGFMTWKGVYHQQSSRHAALASDMMEPYRHIIERVAMHLINTNRITADDFRQTEKQGLRLSAEARRRYITALLRRFEQFKSKENFHSHLYGQCLELKRAMDLQIQFKPFNETK